MNWRNSRRNIKTKVALFYVFDFGSVTIKGFNYSYETSNLVSSWFKSTKAKLPGSNVKIIYHQP